MIAFVFFHLLESTTVLLGILKKNFRSFLAIFVSGFHSYAIYKILRLNSFFVVAKSC